MCAGDEKNEKDRVTCSPVRTNRNDGWGIIRYSWGKLNAPITIAPTPAGEKRPPFAGNILITLVGCRVASIILVVVSPRKLIFSSKAETLRLRESTGRFLGPVQTSDLTILLQNIHVFYISLYVHMCTARTPHYMYWRGSKLLVLHRASRMQRFICLITNWRKASDRLAREDPESENSKKSETLWICRIVGDFLLITTQYLFAAQIHSKGMKLTPENSAILRFYFVTRNLQGIEKKSLKAEVTSFN